MLNSYQTYVDAGIESLQQWYNPTQGLWDTTGWWNAANLLWVLLEYTEKTQTTGYLPIINHIFEVHHGGNCINDYYDDEGWWALSWIKAYDITGNTNYLTLARTIFADMQGGWDTTCGGGIWWSKERSYKNAIANELFFTVAARLYTRASTAPNAMDYFHWAYQEWTWFWNSGLINSYSLINDGLDHNCQNNGGVIWTYNQGVVLGGLVEMYQITHDESYRTVAENIADAAIMQLTDRMGILIEPCENGDCGADGPQFKGIFVRNLATLYQVLPKEIYRHFILTNAYSIVTSNRLAAHQFGLKWAGPVDNVDAARQGSALDTLVAAMSLNLT
ncbi:glycoside hydrolase family 76 protein [Dictyobacter arantiisoli]|uniref:Glycosyl hydrolase n=1 Tax=Dictyobacter arantiisoli TaxID=2014874 RepID=A0A5A5TEI3_9CHLR|nr:glycoside hydrolase family 76 protein [Dictyobacter arantiisoli]GCF09419.1 hypothetical protein KDI_29830 [Dictyobacter arantiisoli]